MFEMFLEVPSEEMRSEVRSVAEQMVQTMASVFVARPGQGEGLKLAGQTDAVHRLVAGFPSVLCQVEQVE